MSKRANFWLMWANFACVLINLLVVDYSEFTPDWFSLFIAGYCLAAAMWCLSDYQKG